MTRQEELKKIAKRYAQDELKDNHSAVEDIVAAAFLNGIDYAENHHHWISVEDELPKEDGEYFTFLYNSGIRVTDFLQGKWQMFGKEPQDGMDVAYWMPIPSVHHLAATSTEERRLP